MKKLSILIALAALVAAAPVVQAEEMTWTGEVLDLACYVAKGAQGAEHAGCAKKCVQAGQPMGLLTDDGTVVLLAASHADAAPYEALKDWAGSQVMVTGEMVERDGVSMVTVTGSEAAG